MSESNPKSGSGNERTGRTSLRAKVVAGLTALGLASGGAAVALHKPQEVAGTPVAASNEHVIENDTTKYLNSPERNDEIETTVNKYSRKIVDLANRSPESVTFNDGQEVGDSRGTITASVNKDGKRFTFQTTVQRTEEGYKFGASDGTEMVRVDSTQNQGDSTATQSVSYSREFWGDGYNPYDVEIGTSLIGSDGSGQGGTMGSGPKALEQWPDMTAQTSHDAEMAAQTALDQMTNEGL